MNYSAFEHLARSIAPLGWEDRYYSMFTAYFDDSGHEDDQLLVVVAGFIADAKDWKEFEALWIAALYRHAMPVACGLPYLHVSEINRKIRTCRQHEACSDHWTDLRRKRMFDELIDIIRGHVSRKFACVVVNEGLADLSEQVRIDCLINAYSAAGRACVAKLREFAFNEHIPYAPRLVFEDGSKGKGKLIDRLRRDCVQEPIFERPRNHPSKDGKFIEAGVIPLQSADLFAHIVFDYARAYLRQEPSLLQEQFHRFKSLPTQELIYAPWDIANLETELPSLDLSYEVLDRIRHENSHTRKN